MAFNLNPEPLKLFKNLERFFLKSFTVFSRKHCNFLLFELQIHSFSVKFQGGLIYFLKLLFYTNILPWVNASNCVGIDNWIQTDFSCFLHIHKSLHINRPSLEISSLKAYYFISLGILISHSHDYFIVLLYYPPGHIWRINQLTDC